MPETTRPRGFLERRLRLGLAHLVRERVRLLRGEGATQGWGADGLGRWVGAAAAAGASLGVPVPELPAMSAALLGRQRGDGSFSAARTPETWWGASRALVGLLEAWAVTRDPALLAGARRLGDWYRRERPAELSGFAGPLYGAAMEGLVALADATGDRAYLELAAAIAGTAEGGFALRGGEGPERHTHSYLTALRGCVLVHAAARAERPLATAVAAWELIAREAMWVTGGVSEGSRYPFESTDEACAVADWFRLSLSFWQATGEARFLEVAELTLLNHLLFDQDQSGGFCTNRSVGRELVWGVRDIVAWWCCSMHGVRALVEAARSAVEARDGGIDVALWLPVEAELEPVPGCRARVVVDGPYPLAARVAVEGDCRSEVPLRMRIPEWAATATVRVDGRTERASPGSFVTIRRRWRPGDVVELAFEPQLRVIPAGGNGFPARAPRPEAETAPAGPSPGGTLADAAIAWGPLVLMIDSSLNPHELHHAKGFELAVPWDGRRGAPDLVRGAAPPGRGEAPFPDACFPVLARDLAGAGEPVRPDDPSWKLAFLVPVAEVTERWSPSGSRTVPYEVRNRLRIVEAGAGPWKDRLATLRAQHEARTAGTTIVAD